LPHDEHTRHFGGLAGEVSLPAVRRPTDVRATAVGLTYSLSRLSGGVLPFVLLPVLYACGAAAMFTVVVIALVIVIAAVALVGPRTTLRGLDEINPN
jgi:putative MFS transporter